MAKAPLRLRGEAPDDVQVIAAFCQDATAKTVDMSYDPEGRRFALMLNRYCWELDLKKRRWWQTKPAPQRVRSVLRFDYVTAVQRAGVDPGDEEKIHNLMSIAAAQSETGYSIQIIFSGQAAIQLTSEAIDLTLEDICEPWAAKRRPDHSNSL